jgi:hypothetical protein
MKKHVVLLITLITATVAIAQTSPSIGIRGGLTSTGMRGDAVSSLNNLLDFTNGAITSANRTGFFAGAYTTIPLSGSIALEPAVYYAQKGYALNGALTAKGADFLGADAGAQLNLHYIDVPVLVKATISGFQVFAGPQLSYLSHAGLKTTAGVLGIALLNKKMDATAQFNRWDAGVTGGVGYQFNNGMNIMAAYDHGLSKVDAGKNTNTYNRSFKIGVGFSF